MKVLITGGTGSLGQILTRTIAGEGYAARILSTRPRVISDPDDIEWAEAEK